MHPVIAEELHRQRVQDWHRRPIGRRQHEEPAVHRVRHSAGWFLVNLGLRLAAPTTNLSPAAR